MTNDLPPRGGGIEQFLGNLLDRTDPSNALVLGPAHPDSALHDAQVAWSVERAAGPVQPTPAVLGWVRDRARSHRPDVVVLGASWPLGELAGALARRPGVPVVAISHGLEAGLAQVGLGWVPARTTAHLAALTVISSWTEERLAPRARCPVHRIPPGVDVDRFHPGVDGTGLRERWGVPVTAPVVGCVSRLVRRKGQDALVASWPRVLAAHPDAWLVIVGTGPMEEQLRASAAGLDQVAVVGEVAWADLPAAHAAVDVFAMPVRSRLLGTDVEGLGIVYLEAQSSGVPVVAGSSGGAPETVIEGVTGHVVDGRDLTDITRRVVELLDDPDRRRAMGIAGRRHAVRRWGWDPIADRFADVLGSVQDPG